MGFALFLKDQSCFRVLLFHFIPDGKDKRVQIIIVIGNSGTVFTFTAFERGVTENPENDPVLYFSCPDHFQYIPEDDLLHFWVGQTGQVIRVKNALAFSLVKTQQILLIFETFAPFIQNSIIWLAIL